MKYYVNLVRVVGIWVEGESQDAIASAIEETLDAETPAAVAVTRQIYDALKNTHIEYDFPKILDPQNDRETVVGTFKVTNGKLVKV